MESRLIPAAVLVPALIWPACNGGTENLGGGDGGSAGAELTSTTGKTTKGASAGDTSGAGGYGTMSAGSTAGSGGLGSGGAGNGGPGSGGSGGNLLPPDAGPIGGVTSAGGNVGAGGGYGVIGSNNGAGGNFGAGGYGNVGSTTTGMGAGGNFGAGGGYSRATEVHWNAQGIPMLTHDSERIYIGGSSVTAVALPDGPGTVLHTAAPSTAVAVDGTHLYICSPGSLSRMSKEGGGTQNYQGAGVDANYNCTAVTVDDTTVSAVWFNPESHALRIRRWAKSDRTEPEDGLELDELGEAYAPALIADGALYYADRTSDELMIGRILLDDFADEPVLNVDAEFDSEYVEPLAVNQVVMYYQSCEQVDRWCSLFSLPNDEDEPIPFEMYQRDSVIEAATPLGTGVVIALTNGIYALTDAKAELAQLWTHLSVRDCGPLLMLDGNLYFAAKPDYGDGATLWRLPVADP